MGLRPESLYRGNTTAIQSLLWALLMTLSSLFAPCFGQSTEPPADAPMNQIRGIRVPKDPEGGSLTVSLEATRAIEYDSRKLSEEDTGDAVRLRWYSQASQRMVKSIRKAKHIHD